MIEPISTNTLYVLLVAAGSTGAAGWSIWREVAASRRESQEGRAALYAHINDLIRQIDETYVRRDVYAADERVRAHRDEEMQVQLRMLTDRSCPLGRDKPPGE